MKPRHVRILVAITPAVVRLVAAVIDRVKLESRGGRRITAEEARELVDVALEELRGLLVAEALR